MARTHGMGVRAVSTPFEKLQHTSQNSLIQRNKTMKVGIATTNKGIPIKWFKESPEPRLSAEKFKPLIELQFSHVLPLSTSCDLLWHSAQKMYTGNQPPTSWAGFNQEESVGTHLPPANITMLPIMDLKSCDESCTYSMMILNEATLLNISTTCITFDQPLWWKAVEIIDAKSMDIIYRLRGFQKS